MKQILYMLGVIMMFFASSFTSSEENKKQILFETISEQFLPTLPPIDSNYTKIEYEFEWNQNDNYTIVDEKLELLETPEQTLQNAFNTKDREQIINAINTIIESNKYLCNLKVFIWMTDNKNDPKMQEQWNLLLQIVKENLTLQDKIIHDLKHKWFNYSTDEMSYIIQLFETDETNYGLKFKRSKELFEYLKPIPIFHHNRESTAENQSFGFYMKKLLLEEDLKALLLHHKYFYLDDQLKSFRILENFIEQNDKISTLKYFNIFANDPKMEQWIIEIFQTETNSHKYLFLEVIQKKQIEIVKIILNFFLNFCDKNENFKILIKLLDNPTNKNLPVLPFAIKQRNIRMSKVLVEAMLKIPNYELENSNLTNVPKAFFNMLIEANKDVQIFLTKSEVDNILQEHDIKKTLKLMEFPDVVSKWNLIRLCFMIKTRNKVTENI